jgi:hypothetical protein
MAVALADGMAKEPRIAVLRLQTAQATASRRAARRRSQGNWAGGVRLAGAWGCSWGTVTPLKIETAGMFASSAKKRQRMLCISGLGDESHVVSQNKYLFN